MLSARGLYLFKVFISEATSSLQMTSTGGTG